MKKFYPISILSFFIFLFAILPIFTFSQVCNTLNVTYVTTESRCAATGTVLINATGGSGNYHYKATGPVIINYTSSNLITGLMPGRYLITIKDITTNCIYSNDSITIEGNYVAPNFIMVTTDVTCINGSDGKITVTGQTFGRAPFSYKIIAPSASGVGTVSPTGTFTGLISGNYLIQLSDSCGAIQTRSASILNYDWSINNYSVTKFGCDSISVIINLIDSKGNITPNAIFNSFSYGASVTTGDTTWFTNNAFKYYIGKKRTVKLFVKDGCGNIKSVTWTHSAIPNVNSSVTITNRACSTFTAKVNGQVNLTAPSFCLYDAGNALIACNSTGLFNSLLYGSYCIKITDVCYDTVITRCFTINKPKPSVDLNVDIVTICNSFTATITGQANINASNYCLYNASNVLIVCNSTGIFTNLVYGTYCIKVVNDPACYDTTITRCFIVNRPVPTINSIVDITNLSCSTFTATITDTANWKNPQFCLFTPDHVLIICNSTGVFNNLLFGTYCIDVVNSPGCYDTTITRCFTVKSPVPSVNASVTRSNKTCTSFTAIITGQTNINSPQYCLYNNLNVLVLCNTTGTFSNIPYGDYCIKIQNSASCYDTLITRCFTESQTPVDIDLSAKKSCTNIGLTDLKVIFQSGTPAYSVSLFSPVGTLMQTISTSSSSYTFLNIPNLVSPLKYKIIVTDLCGIKDSGFITPRINIANRVVTITPKCPSGIWPNGSGDVIVNITDNNIGGNITPKIIKKNGAVVSINPSLSSGYNYTFLDLGPAIYVIDTYIDDCNKHVYDTIEVRIYLYPILSSSNAYQCDNNGFSVSANVLGGKSPYTYEIIGSVPSTPSIVTAPQTSSVFSINNGTIYSLVRLRVVDACGNASLHDVSVLPLANFIVTAGSAQCFNNSLTMVVDSLANTTYIWYKRIVPNDSIIVGTGPTYYIPNLISSDTGRYFCKIVVNNGCMIKYANYVINGGCYMVLPNEIQLNGEKQAAGNKLYWDTDALNIKDYSLQRSETGIAGFETIHNFTNTGDKQYLFLDKNHIAGNNYYRLKFTITDNSIKYSNIISISNTKFDISFYPNPVNNILYISISNKLPKNYGIEMYNITGQKVMYKQYYMIQNAIISFPRTAVMKSGIYSITITDLQSMEKQTYKVIYK